MSETNLIQKANLMNILNQNQILIHPPLKIQVISKLLILHNNHHRQLKEKIIANLNHLIKNFNQIISKKPVQKIVIIKKKKKKI